jgi:2,4-diaminopentanoate dehydrogenase
VDQQRYRVAQWGTGHTGLHSLRKVIEHPHYDLVGVRVYSDAKVGRDAGDLCGIDPTGVLATRDIEDILVVEPDCVMYMPLLDHDSIDDLCRLLESGANIVTTINEFYHPPTVDPDVRERIEDACARGGSSLFDTGGAPGFIGEIFPLAALLMERQLHRFSIVQFANLEDRQSPELLAEFFGGDPAMVDLAKGADRLARTDGASLRQLGDAISLPIDEIATRAAIATAVTTKEIGVTTIEAGTVGAWQMGVVGLRGGEPLLEYSRTMYVTTDLDPAWEIHDTGWHVVVDGDAPMDIEIRFPSDNYGAVSPGYNAHVPVNSVAAVCAAAPGIRVTADLHLIPTFA